MVVRPFSRASPAEIGAGIPARLAVVLQPGSGLLYTTSNGSRCKPFNKLLTLARPLLLCLGLDTLADDFRSLC